MANLDEAGFSILVEGVEKVHKESVLSIAQAARRSGSVVVVVGRENLKILCEVDRAHPAGLRWYVDGFECPASKISYLLDAAQGE